MSQQANKLVSLWHHYNWDISEQIYNARDLVTTFIVSHLLSISNFPSQKSTAVNDNGRGFSSAHKKSNHCNFQQGIFYFVLIANDVYTNNTSDKYGKFSIWIVQYKLFVIFIISIIIVVVVQLSIRSVEYIGGVLAIWRILARKLIYFCPPPHAIQKAHLFQVLRMFHLLFEWSTSWSSSNHHGFLSIESSSLKTVPAIANQEKWLTTIH